MATQQDYRVNAHLTIAQTLDRVPRALAMTATSLGNVSLAGKVIKTYFGSKESYKVLYLCDKKVLLDQTQECLCSMFNTDDVYFSSSYKDMMDGKNILCYTFSDILSTDWESWLIKGVFDLIIVDRAHFAVNGSSANIVKYISENRIPVLGLTTIPNIENEKVLVSRFGQPVVSVSLEETIALGELSNFSYKVMNDHLKDKFHTIIGYQGGKRPTFRSLNETLFIEKRDEELVETIKQHTVDAQKTIIFCKSVAHADTLHQLFGGAMCRTYHSGFNSAVRQQSLNEFKYENVRYLLLVDMVDHLIDLPQIDIVVFLHGTGSKHKFYTELTLGLKQNLKTILVLDFGASLDRLMMIRAIAEKSARTRVLKKKQEYSVITQPSMADVTHSRISEDDTVKKDIDVLPLCNDGSGLVVDLKTHTSSSPGSPVSLSNSMYRIKGDNFEFIFDEEVMTAIEIAQKIRAGYYPTYEETKQAALTLGAKSKEAYLASYRNDLRLPKDPDKRHSKEFIHWDEFLETTLAPFYRSSKEDQATQIFEVLYQNNLYSFENLTHLGAQGFQKMSFGIFGDGIKFASILLGTEGIKQIDAMVLSNIAEKLAWKPRAEVLA